jgi:hypothetical protein
VFEEIVNEFDVTGFISTFLFWFAIIAIVAIVFGALAMLARAYIFMQILGGGAPGNRISPMNRNIPCQFCGHYTPPDSTFCKNCGAKLR